MRNPMVKTITIRDEVYKKLLSAKKRMRVSANCLKGLPKAETLSKP